nr:hypothetical protein [Leuconostoc citreum]
MPTTGVQEKSTLVGALTIIIATLGLLFKKQEQKH